MTSDAMNCYSHVMFGGNTYPLPIFKSEVEFYKLYALPGQSVTCRYFLLFYLFGSCMCDLNPEEPHAYQAGIVPFILSSHKLEVPWFFLLYLSL